MMKNLPNILTVIRLIVAILFVPTFFYEQANNLGNTLSLWMYVFASFTDVLDGYIARRFTLISNFGKIFDPIADKLLQFLVALCLCFVEPFFIVLVVFIFIKELFMLIGTIKLYKIKTVVSANVYGKLASCVYFALFFVMIGFRDMVPQAVKYSLLTVFLLASLFAFFNYIKQYLRIKQESCNKSC